MRSKIWHGKMFNMKMVSLRKKLHIGGCKNAKNQQADNHSDKGLWDIYLKTKIRTVRWSTIV